jgi:hypothetical protein
MDRYRPKLGPQLLSKFFRGSSIEINIFLPVNAQLGLIMLPACVLYFPLASHWSARFAINPRALALASLLPIGCRIS